MTMTDEPTPTRAKWTGERDGALVEVDGDSWGVTGPDPQAVRRLTEDIIDAVDNGWTNPPGWSIDRTPGWNDEWTFLRLSGLGVTNLDGPFPQRDDHYEGEIVG